MVCKDEKHLVRCLILWSSLIWFPVLLFFINWYSKPLIVRTALETQYIAEDRLTKTRDVVADEQERKNAREAAVAEASWEAAYKQPVFNEAGQAVEKVGHYKLKRWLGEHRQYKIDNVAPEGLIEPDYVVVFRKITPQAGTSETTTAEENK